MLSYLSFHIVETPGGYNALQQLSYAAVIFLLAPFSIATGMAMSPAVAARFPKYIKLFHGRQGARSLHFLALCTFIVFFIGHVTIVALHGFRRELAMIVLGETHNPHLTLRSGGLAVRVGRHRGHPCRYNHVFASPPALRPKSY